MLIIGHRGAGWQRSSCPLKENTMEAFQYALDNGADGIETDVRASNTGAAVLHHDPVNDKPTAELLLLEELLDWAPDDFLLNLEVKHPSAVPGLLDVMKRYKKRYLITSFWHNVAFAVSRATSADCGLLMPIRPIYIKPFLQLIPFQMTHIVWDYNVYDENLVEGLSKFKHIIYNCPSDDGPPADGIISDYIHDHRKRYNTTTEKV